MVLFMFTVLLWAETAVGRGCRDRDDGRGSGDDWGDHGCTVHLAGKKFEIYFVFGKKFCLKTASDL